jgi:hypothetical protein
MYFTWMPLPSFIACSSSCGSGRSGRKLMLQAQQLSSSIGTHMCPPSACGPNGGISVNQGKIHCVMRQ